MTPQQQTDTPTRPRVEGVREQEILGACVAVLTEVGYDRLTMDAVATAAKASKATLYRRWSSKPELVIDALVTLKETPGPPEDTGTLRGDLLAAFCGAHGFGDQENVGLFASVVTAVTTDPEFAAAFRERFVAPKAANLRTIYLRAQARGEVHPDADLDVLEPALPGIVLHRTCVLGEQPTPELIARIVDHVILPAATARPAGR